MPLLYGTLDGGFVVSPDPVPTGYEPVVQERASVAQFWSLLDDGYAYMADRDLVETLWEGMIDLAAGDLLREYTYDATTSLLSTPVISQRRWVSFDLTTSPDFLEAPPAGSASWIVDPTYPGGPALVGTWKNRVGVDASHAPLRIPATHEVSLRWEFVLRLASIQRGGIAFLGYSSEDMASGALLAGVSRFPTDSEENPEKALATLVHVGSAGTVVFEQSLYLLSIDTDYHFEAVYSAETAVVSLTVSAERGLKFESGSGLTGEAAGDVPRTNLVRFLGVDLAAEGVAVGDVLEYGGLESEVIEVAGEYLSTRAYLFPADAAALDCAVFGRIQVASCTLDIGARTGDVEREVDRFGVSSFDFRRLTSELYGEPKDALGKAVRAATRAWTYSDPSSPHQIIELPLLQDRVRGPGRQWVGGVDVHLRRTDAGTLFIFPNVPADRVWAEYVGFDERLLSEVYGADVGVPGDSSEDYKTRLRGLYFAYLSGPRRSGIRTGVHLLLGLPVADVAGVVEEIEVDYTGLLTRIRVAGRDYTFPKRVGTDLVVGNEVKQFEPLCRGVSVVDWTKDPYWWLRHTGMHELQKYHTFELQAETDVPNLQGLPFALSFLENISPTWKTPVFLAVSRSEDTLDVSDSLALVLVLRLWDTPCDLPIPRFDSYDYSPDVTDWRFDQIEGTAWAVTAGIQRHPRFDGVRDYLTDLTGTFSLTNAATAASTTGGALTAEVGAVGPVVRKYVAASRVIEGVAGEATAGSHGFVDATPGAFDDVEAGGVLFLGADVHRILAVEDGELTLDEPPAATATGLSWIVMNEAQLRGQVDEIVDDDNLVFSEAFTGPTGDYVLSLIDLAVMNVYFDQYDERCPEEELGFVATLSVGYGQALLTGRNHAFSVGSNVVTGFADAESEIGVGAITDRYLSDPRGRWHRIALVLDAAQVQLATPVTEDFNSVPAHVSVKALDGTFAFVNGSASVAATDSQTGVLAAGDYVQAVPCLGDQPLVDCPVMQIDSIDGPGTGITLTAVYSGLDAPATKVILRGASSLLPRDQDLPDGREPTDVSPLQFTAFQPAAGATIESTVVEP